MNRLACLLGPFIWECFVCGEETEKSVVESRGKKVAIGRGGWIGIRARGGNCFLSEIGGARVLQ